MSSPRRFVGKFVLPGLLVAFWPPAWAADRVYVAGFQAVYWTWPPLPPPPGPSKALAWVSRGMAFNVGQFPESILWTAVFGPNGRSTPSEPASVSALPGAGVTLPGAMPSDPVFNEYDVPASIVVSGEVEKVAWDAVCAADPGNPASPTLTLPQGRAPMPVYRGLFPAGARVLTNEMVLGNPAVPDSCGANQRYFRRVNVTLFNGGAAPGTFVVRALPRQSSTRVIFEMAVTLGPGEVRQVNRLPIPVEDVPENRYPGGVSVWLTVTCDQPFLGYASTIFENPEPGALPFEVFAFRSGT